MLIQKLQQKLLERAESNSLRKLTVSKGMVDFYSNDYLGLARNKELAESIATEVGKFSGNLNGSTGSRLLSGNTTYTETIEVELANLFRAEKLVLMNSGYNANLSVLASIPQKGDTILYDEYIHASCKDGYRLSFASRFPFKHNCVEELEHKIKKAKGTVFVVVESIYSMDGDQAPLREMVELCNQYGAYLIIDEAHSTGIIGEGGNGLACALGIEQSIFARIYTFGKGMGIHGACVAGSKILIDYLINYARPLIYTTALPLHSVVSIKHAFRYVAQHSELQEQLKNRIEKFKSSIPVELIQQGRYIESTSPIQVIKVAGNNEVKKAAALLQSSRLDVRPILSPTVPAGEQRLRICLHVYNTDEELEQLKKILKEIK